MIRIGVIVGSTRPQRRSPLVASWVEHHAAARSDVEIEVLDLHVFDLPMYDEPEAPAVGTVRGERARAWAAEVDRFDAFVIVVPEYNHSYPAVVKNAIDLVFHEWNDKAVGFVSYGMHGGVRAVEHLRSVVSEVKLASVRTHVVLSLFNDFTLTGPVEPGNFTPGPHQEQTLERLLDELVAWAGALRTLRHQSLLA